MQKVKKTALVWFRNDLRITNQQSLSNAIANHENIIGIFHFPIQKVINLFLIIALYIKIQKLEIIVI